MCCCSGLGLTTGHFISAPLKGNTHQDLGVSHGVFGHGDPVLGLLPVWRLVVDVGDDDRQLHRAAAVASVRRHDLLVDPGCLWANGSGQNLLQR